MKEHIPHFENKEHRAFGFDVVIRSHFQRHAPENKQEKELTEDGITMSEQYAQQLHLSDQEKPYLFKAYSSEIKRARDTAQIIVDTVNTSKKGHTRITRTLGKINEDFRIPIDILDKPYSEYRELSKEKINMNGEELSLHDLARRVALHIKHFAEMSRRFKNHSRVDLVNITHLPWISAFLKEALGENINKRKDRESILKPQSLDGFEIVIKRNGDELSLVIKMNNEEFPLTEEMLDRIIGENNGGKDD